MKIRRLMYRYVPSERLLEIQNWINMRIDKTKNRKELNRLWDHNLDIFFAVLWKNRSNRAFVEQSVDRIIDTLERKDRG